MKRNRISLKKANMISSARKSANSNSFIVFGFYDTLEKVMSENNFFPRKYEIQMNQAFSQTLEDAK